MALVLGPFGKEQQALAGLRGMGGVVVSDILRLLVAQVGRQTVMLHSALAQPEVFLGENQAPVYEFGLAIRYT